MKFRIGPPPENSDFTPGEPWQPLDEPGPRTFTWVALPVGLLSTAAFCILWLSLTDLTLIDFLYWFFYKLSGVRLLFLFFSLIVIHELLHAIFHPRYGFSSNSILGVWISKGAFYAHWDNEWSRNRAMACIISPFFVLTVLPFLVSLLPYTLVPWLDENIMSMLAYVSVMNALFAAADLMGARLLFLQIPRNGIVRNQGFHTYWRVDGEN